MTVEQLELMRSLHIASENGGYRFGGYLYERLGDAVSHARHLRWGQVPNLPGSVL